MSEELLSAIHGDVKKNSELLLEHGKLSAAHKVEIREITRRLESGKVANLESQRLMREEMSAQHKQLSDKVDDIHRIIPNLATDDDCLRRKQEVKEEIGKTKKVLAYIFGSLAVGGSGAATGTEAGRNLLSKLWHGIFG